MKVKELRDILKTMEENEEIAFYVYDYEYDDEEPYEIGRAKFINYDGCINLGVNK